MPRHVSSPRLLTWRQRTAIAAPILLLASIATVAVAGGEGDDPTATPPTGEVNALTIASATPTGEPPDPRAGSSDPGTTPDSGDTDDPETDDSGGRSDDDSGDGDGPEATPDVIGPDRSNDNQTTPPDDATPETDEPETDDPETVDPDTDHDDGGTDGDGSDNGTGNDGNGGDGDEGDTDPTTPPEDDESDGPDPNLDSITRRCTSALEGLLGDPGPTKINGCVNAVLGGTPLPKVIDGIAGHGGDDSGSGLCVLGILFCRD